MAVPLDGVLVGMRDDQRAAKRARKAACGPAGFQEVGGATLSLLAQLIATSNASYGGRGSSIRFAA